MASKERLLLGIDIGATSIKAGVFTPQGRLVGLAARPNGPKPEPGGQEGWLIWDAEEIWGKACACVRQAAAEAAAAGQVLGVSVTGFGTDGTPLDDHGHQLYPIISWHDSRCLPQRDWLNEKVGPYRIYEITGYHNYPINALNRWMWLKENAPEALARCRHWLQVQDYIAFRLSAGYSTDCTIASTTMALDLRTRTWSTELLEAAGIDPSMLSPASEGGTKIGEVTQAAAERTGLPVGAAVVTGGHDCEMATLGAGVVEEETFVDITGTWEIILANLDHFTPSREAFAAGLDHECHAFPGYYNCQGLMLAGGVVEWVRSHFYRETPEPERAYATMLEEAEATPLGCDGVVVLPAFVRGMGPAQAHDPLGTILGLRTTTQRGQVVRATFEATCFQLRQQLEAIERCHDLKAESLRAVGGAQKNPLWLQMKADVTGRTVQAPLHEEITLLGAAILAGVGSGVYADVREALRTIPFPLTTYEPDGRRFEQYGDLYSRVYLKIAESLEPVYRAVHASQR